MKLLIKDFSKIHEATIEFNGITVIAGNNNTGKSTVGKILFALFNSVNQHFTTFTLPRKLTKPVYTRPALSPLDFLRFGL